MLSIIVVPRNPVVIKEREQFKPAFHNTLVQRPCSFRYKYLIGLLLEEGLDLRLMFLEKFLPQPNVSLAEIRDIWLGALAASFCLSACFSQTLTLA
jgi:hypothetical protein